MTKPTNAQLTILSQAAARPDGSVLPVPDTIKAKGAALDRSLKALLKRGWLVEREAGAKDPAWRSDDDAKQMVLVISAAGCAAIGVEPPRDDEDTADNAAPAPRRPKGKLGMVLGALEERGGATLAELVAQTGWLPHTTRAALTGLRKRGYSIALSDEDGRKAYHLAQTAA